MKDEKTVTIPLSTAICAARHFVAAHESAVTGKPVEWGGACMADICHAECGAPCRLSNGVLDWIEIMRPLFDATGIHPHLCRSDGPDCDEGSVAG